MSNATAIEVVQKLREELAYEQDKGRAKDLRNMIVLNERALPHLSGIPRMHAQKRIADAKADLVTIELLISLYENHATSKGV